jgi:hypothetical protein
MKRITMPPDLPTRIISQVALRLEDINRAARGHLTLIERPVLDRDRGDGLGGVRALHRGVNLGSVHLSGWTPGLPRKDRRAYFIEDDCAGILVNATHVVVEILKPLYYSDRVEVIGGVAELFRRYPHVSASFPAEGVEEGDIVTVLEPSRKMGTKFKAQPRKTDAKQVQEELEYRPDNMLIDKDTWEDIKRWQDDAVQPAPVERKKGRPSLSEKSKKKVALRMCWCGFEGLPTISLRGSEWTVSCQHCGNRFRRSSKYPKAEVAALWGKYIEEGTNQMYLSPCSCGNHDVELVWKSNRVGSVAYNCPKCIKLGEYRQNPKLAAGSWNAHRAREARPKKTVPAPCICGDNRPPRLQRAGTRVYFECRNCKLASGLQNSFKPARMAWNEMIRDGRAPELHTCSYCNTLPKIERVANAYGSTYRVVCPHCGRHGPEWDKPRKAGEMWNKKLPIPAKVREDEEKAQMERVASLMRHHGWQ